MKRRTMVGEPLHLVEGQGRGGGTNLQQVTQHRGLVLGRLGAEGGPGLPGLNGCRGRTAGGTGYYLQSTYRLRLPAVRLSTIVFAEANPSIVRQGFSLALRDRLLCGGRGRLRFLY